jgi:hypothetical protein
MPRRDVVLTGLIAFGAGVAVGANWPKIRKKIGPLVESLGLKLADLGDVLSASGLDEFVPQAQAGATGSRTTARRKASAKARKAGKAAANVAEALFDAPFGAVRPGPVRKRSSPRSHTSASVQATGTDGS